MNSQDVILRPPHEPTDEFRKYIRKMAACGLDPAQCCAILSITLEDFERYYRRVYDTGTSEMVVAVGSEVIAAAIDKKHPQFFQCASFVLRARGGWRDIRAVETTQKDLPEEQKQKLIDQLTERILAEKLKETVPT
jgi:hypothetical protein